MQRTKTGSLALSLRMPVEVQRATDMRKPQWFHKLIVWIFLGPSFLLSAVAYWLFPRWLRAPFMQTTQRLLRLRKSYVMPVKALSANQITIPENADLQYVDRLTPRDFEHFVGELLTMRGFDQVRVTQASGDYGVDVLARKGKKHYAIQAKLYSNNVGTKAVSEPVAGLPFYQCQVAMVVTNSYFTKAAKTFANKVGCELVDRDVLKQWLQEYHLAAAPSITNGVRLQLSRHRFLLAALAGLSVLALLLFALAEPLCAVFC